jgi:hypothetical protein
VWRRVHVPSAATLGVLHQVVQAVMGWEGYHLHAFTAPGGRCYGENGAAETVALAAVLPIHRPLTPDLVGVVRGELGLADPTHPGQHLAQHRRPPAPTAAASWSTGARCWKQSARRGTTPTRCGHETGAGAARG